MNRKIEQHEMNFANNIQRFGIIFMKLLWLENRISQLIIFQKKPHLIDEINKSKKGVKLSDEFIEIRDEYFGKMFSHIKNDFKDKYDLPEDIENEIEWAYNLRNAIGHSIVSGQRDYLLFLPTGSNDKKNKILDAFNIPDKDRKEKNYLKLSYHDEKNYKHDYNRIDKINEYLDSLAVLKNICIEKNTLIREICMNTKKRINHFKKSQDEKVRENTKKIEIALSNLPKKIEKVTLSKVVRLVAKETGLHFTTINKNETYTAMCNEKFLSLQLNSMDKGKKKKNTELDNELRLLQLENANLKNQVKTLSNVVQRLEEGGASVESEEQVDYKDKFEKLLKHFEDQLEIKDGQVIDPYAGIRPVVICNIKNIKE